MMLVDVFDATAIMEPCSKKIVEKAECKMLKGKQLCSFALSHFYVLFYF